MEIQTLELQCLFDRGVDFYDRRIHLCGEITEEMSAVVIRGLYVLARTSDAIEILIQSPGGGFASSFAVYDTIRSLNCNTLPIHTIGIGEVCSAALLILSSGYTRSATENTYAMQHTGIVEIPPMETHAALSSAVATEDMVARTWELLASHTKMTAAQWKKEAKEAGEIWMTAKQLKARGVIDDIIEPAMRPKKPRKKSASTKRQSQGPQATTTRSK